MIKKSIFISILGITILNAGFMEDIASTMGSMIGDSKNQKVPAQTQSSQTQIISQLTQMVNVDPKQAVGGTAALMALASSKMPKDSYNSIVNSIPGLSSILSSSGGGALGSIAGVVSGTMGEKNTLQSAFKALGMDSDTVSKFVPALLRFLKIT